MRAKCLPSMRWSCSTLNQDNCKLPRRLGCPVSDHHILSVFGAVKEAVESVLVELLRKCDCVPSAGLPVIRYKAVIAPECIRNSPPQSFVAELAEYALGGRRVHLGWFNVTVNPLLVGH